MNRPSVETLTRRASLTTLGLTGLAAVTRPGAASAKKKGHKFQQCKQEAEACNVRVLADCTGSQAECAAQVACCNNLTHCKFDDFLLCLIAAEGTAAAVVPGPRRRAEADAPADRVRSPRR